MWRVCCFTLFMYNIGRRHLLFYLVSFILFFYKNSCMCLIGRKRFHLFSCLPIFQRSPDIYGKPVECWRSFFPFFLQTCFSIILHSFSNEDRWCLQSSSSKSLPLLYYVCRSSDMLEKKQRKSQILCLWESICCFKMSDINPNITKE